MKKMIWQSFALTCVLGLVVSAVAQTEPATPPDANVAPATPEPADVASPTDIIGAVIAQPGTNASETVTAPPTTNLPPVVLEDQPAAEPAGSNAAPTTFTPPTLVSTNADELRLNFRNAPLEMVLNYLSDAAGFIIVLDAPVHGTVNVISSHPMTRSEAVDLLNSVLNKNGLAAIRDGRTLTIVDKTEAKTRDIPVKVSNDPEQIPKNAEIVTQIIPVRFVEARQLVTDLSSFVSAQATIVANEAGNSVVITDTQSNIRHLVEIIRAIDNSAEGETEIRVFHLDHANPTDVAAELGEIFPSGSSSGNNNAQSPIRFGGGAGGPGSFFAQMMAGRGGGPGGGGSSQSSRQQKQTQVVAVADLRTSSVIVTSSKDLMQEIASMMKQLDVASTRDQKVFVYHMNNGDAQQTVQVLQGMFGGSSTSRNGSSSGSTANSALMARQQNNATTTGSSSSTTSSTFGGGTSGGLGAGGGRQGF